MQSFSHQEKRAKIFSSESRPYLSNSPQTNLAILHDEYSYKKWGWRRVMVAVMAEGGREGGARWGFLIRTVYLVSTKNKIKTVVRRSPFSSQVMEDAGKAAAVVVAARPVEVNRWWWGLVARRREAWRISSLIPHYLPSLTQVSSSLSAGEDRQREGGGAVGGVWAGSGVKDCGIQLDQLEEITWMILLPDRFVSVWRVLLQKVLQF